jgi:cytochrome b involved in lipid metabolism
LLFVPYPDVRLDPRIGHVKPRTTDNQWYMTYDRTLTTLGTRTTTNHSFYGIKHLWYQIWIEMGKGGQQRENKETVYTWSEVQLHTKKDDKWLVIDGQIYNITNLELVMLNQGQRTTNGI